MVNRLVAGLKACATHCVTHGVILTSLVSFGCRGAQPDDVLGRAAFEGRTPDVLAQLERGEGSPCHALVWAARGGWPAPILAITARGVNPNACHEGVHGWTPLMHAIHKSQRAAVQALIGAGVNVNAAAPHAFTPLMMAVGNGDLPIVRMLLAAGADPRATTPNGTSVIGIAISGGAFTDIERPLLGACRLDVVRELVAAGAPDPELQPTFRWIVARTIARLNGCEEALRLIDRR